jgi:hypothetical protein
VQDEFLCRFCAKPIAGALHKNSEKSYIKKRDFVLFVQLGILHKKSIIVQSH